MKGQLVNTPAEKFPGGGPPPNLPPSNLPPPDLPPPNFPPPIPPPNLRGVGLVKDAAQVDLRGVGWKEIVLTRDDFERLNSRLKRPEIPLVTEEKYEKPIFVFLLPLLYFILVFKDDQMPELIEGLLKVFLFGLAVFFIMYDDTLKRMRVNITSRILIGFCFGGLLVAASTI
uniref:Uncharacterized protein n=1 Tax=viral metagenome TaxID=1070528 RepID=A0A6C0IY48_9ZZZZ